MKTNERFPANWKGIMRILLFVTLFGFSTVNARTDLREIMKADLSGVWSVGKYGCFGLGLDTCMSYIYLYPDKSMKALGPDCSLMEKGTWKFEIGALTLYDKEGKQLMWTQIIDLKAGQKVVLDTSKEWLFLGSNTDSDC